MVAFGRWRGCPLRSWAKLRSSCASSVLGSWFLQPALLLHFVRNGCHMQPHFFVNEFLQKQVRRTIMVRSTNVAVECVRFRNKQTNNQTNKQTKTNKQKQKTKTNKQKHTNQKKQTNNQTNKTKQTNKVPALIADPVFLMISISTILH